MQLASVTLYDNREYNLQHWSGTSYYIARAFEAQGVKINHIGPLQEDPSWRYGLRSLYYRYVHHKVYEKMRDPEYVRYFAPQIMRALQAAKSDVVFGQGSIPLAFVQCRQPIVFWCDATWASAQQLHGWFENVCDRSVAEGHYLDRLILQRCALALYSSHWAARSAIEYYQADPAKVKVVPFGANLPWTPPPEDIQEIIRQRPQDRCQLLFIGRNWYYKGGHIALEVARLLNQAGLPTQLTVVGCMPPLEKPWPEFLNCVGTVDKSAPEGLEQLYRLFAQSHFMIMPTVWDSYGIVFCEANAFGVPNLAFDFAGVPTIIHQGVNGYLFPVGSSVQAFCDVITNLFANYPRYLEMAQMAYNEYQTRLNWTVAGQTATSLIREVWEASRQ